MIALDHRAHPRQVKPAGGAPMLLDARPPAPCVDRDGEVDQQPIVGSVLEINNADQGVTMKSSRLDEQIPMHDPTRQMVDRTGQLNVNLALQQLDVGGKTAGQASFLERFTQPLNPLVEGDHVESAVSPAPKFSGGIMQLGRKATDDPRVLRSYLEYAQPPAQECTGTSKRTGRAKTMG